MPLPSIAKPKMAVAVMIAAVLSSAWAAEDLLLRFSSLSLRPRTSFDDLRKHAVGLLATDNLRPFDAEICRAFINDETKANYQKVLQRLDDPDLPIDSAERPIEVAFLEKMIIAGGILITSKDKKVSDFGRQLAKLALDLIANISPFVRNWRFSNDQNGNNTLLNALLAYKFRFDDTDIQTLRYLVNKMDEEVLNTLNAKPQSALELAIFAYEDEELLLFSLRQRTSKENQLSALKNSFNKVDVFTWVSVFGPICKDFIVENGYNMERTFARLGIPYVDEVDFYLRINFFIAQKPFLPSFMILFDIECQAALEVLGKLYHPEQLEFLVEGNPFKFFAFLEETCEWVTLPDNVIHSQKLAIDAIPEDKAKETFGQLFNLYVQRSDIDPNAVLNFNQVFQHDSDTHMQLCVALFAAINCKQKLNFLKTVFAGFPESLVVKLILQFFIFHFELFDLKADFFGLLDRALQRLRTNDPQFQSDATNIAFIASQLCLYLLKLNYIKPAMFTFMLLLERGARDTPPVFLEDFFHSNRWTENMDSLQILLKGAVMHIMACSPQHQNLQLIGYAMNGMTGVSLAQIYLSSWSSLELLLENRLDSESESAQWKVTVKLIDSAMELFQSSAEMSSNDCSICLDAERQSEKRISLACGHGFHWSCIKGWLQNQMACPFCRADAKPQNPEFLERHRGDPIFKNDIATSWNDLKRTLAE